MEDLKTVEVNNDNGDLVIGLLAYAVVGIFLYEFGKKRGAKRANLVTTSFVKGIMLGIDAKDKTKDE